MGKILKKTLRNIFNLLFSVFLFLLGLGMLITPTSMPGTDRNTTTAIAIVIMAIGGALYKILGIRAETRVQAKAWREVMEE